VYSSVRKLLRSRKSRENVGAKASASKVISTGCLDRDRTVDAKNASFYEDLSTVDVQTLEFSTEGQVSSLYASISLCISYPICES